MTPFVDIHTHKLLIGNRMIGVTNIMPFDEVPANRYLFSAGIHPWHIDAGTVDEYKRWLALAVLSEQCIAIGEAGLDNRCSTGVELQMDIFRWQAELSVSLGKPLIIHCVGMYNQIYTLSKEYPNHPVWILHSYGSSVQMVSQLQSENVMFSFGKGLFGKSAKQYEALKAVPLNRLFLETDDSEVDIEEVYSIATVKLNIEIDILKTQLFNNFNIIFNGSQLA